MIIRDSSDYPNPEEAAADLRADARASAQRAQARADAAAAGRYVPSANCDIVAGALGITFAMARLGNVTVFPMRELVYTVPAANHLTVPQVAAIVGNEYDVARDPAGTTWIKATPEHPYYRE